MDDLVLRAPRALLPDGERPATVLVEDGRITGITDLDAEVASAAREVVLTDDEVLLPGLVDTHVHVNEPGRTDWEGFASATRAAAAGGVTTIVDMPLNSIPPTTDVAALRTKQAVAREQVSVDVAFWGGAVPGNAHELAPLHEAGVMGFKCFLVDSGVPEFPPLDDSGLLEALRVLADLDALMVVHAEDATVLDAAPPATGRGYDGFLASRPPGAEVRAIERLLEAARVTGVRVHVLHLSAADALPLLAQARSEGVRVTAETCPHYLSLDASSIADGDTTAKCCPPIRGRGNQDALWQGLADGVVDVVVSDHSPCTADLKQLDVGDFGAAWGGIASLQLGLPVVWTAARERGVPLAEVVRRMTSASADLVGLTTKGRLEVGAAADLVVFAPDEEVVVDPQQLQHKNPVTAYAGRTLTGAVRRTLLAGRVAGAAAGPGAAAGRLLERGRA